MEKVGLLILVVLTKQLRRLHKIPDGDFSAKTFAATNAVRQWSRLPSCRDSLIITIDGAVFFIPSPLRNKTKGGRRLKRDRNLHLSFYILHFLLRQLCYNYRCEHQDTAEGFSQSRHLREHNHRRQHTEHALQRHYHRRYGGLGFLLT